MSASHREANIELLLLGVAVVWAANYPIAKYGLAGLNVFAFNAIRYCVATACLLILLAVRPAWRPVARNDWPKLVGAGILANVVYQMAFITGLSMTTAGNTAVLLSTSPLWTVLLNAWYYHEPVPRSMWLGMAISLCGIVLIVAGSGAHLAFGSEALTGDLICLGAAALWGLNTNIQKPLLTRYSPMQLTLIMTAIGAIGLTLIAVPALRATPWADTHWSYEAAAFTSGALSIAAASVVWSAGVQRLGPGRTANFNNLVPVLAFVVSYLTLKESLSLLQCVGAAVTVSGVWIARRG